MSALLLVEGCLSHRATGSSDGSDNRCQKKKKWPPWSTNLVEARGVFLKYSNGRYGISFNSNGSKICSHTLPEPGLAFIIRHKVMSNSWSLLVSQIQTSENSEDLGLLLQFDNAHRYLMWEKKLREKLKVYSYDVTVAKDQEVESGDAVIHVTSKFVLVTKNYQNSKYKSIYLKSLTRDVICQHGIDGEPHKIHARYENGKWSVFKFYSSYFHDISKSLKMFRNTLETVQGGEIQNVIAKNGFETSKIPKNISNDTQRTSKHVESKKEVRTNGHITSSQLKDSRPTSRYVKLESPIDEELECYKEGDKLLPKCYPKKCQPLLYSYIDLSAVEKPPEYQSLVKPDEISQLNKDLSAATKGYVEVKTLSEESNKQIAFHPETGLLKDSRSIYISYPTTSSLDSTELYDNVTTTGSLGEGYLDCYECVLEPDISPVPSNQGTDSDAYDDDLLMSLDDVLAPGPSKSKCGCEDLSSDGDFGSPQSISGYSAGLDEVENDSKDVPQMLEEPCATSCNNGCNAEDEEYHQYYNELSADIKAQTPPPIIPRKKAQRCPNQLQCSAVKVVYEDPGKTVDTKQEPVQIFVSLFASEMDCGGAWTIGVTILERQDTKTLQVLKRLEEECGRHQLTTPRPIDVSSELLIQTPVCADGFEVICGEPQTLKYSDLQQLGPLKWIVAEFQFLHVDESKPIFKCTICVEDSPVSLETDKSAFTSQKITVVKKLSRLGTPPTWNAPRSLLEISCKNRLSLCQLLDLPAPLGNNWKALAAEIGLDNTEIRIIEHSKLGSSTEQVLQLLEAKHIEKCNTTYLRTVFQDLRRLDVLDLLC